MDKSADTHYSG